MLLSGINIKVSDRDLWVRVPRFKADTLINLLDYVMCLLSGQGWSRGVI
jgi:hypothetical protein